MKKQPSAGQTGSAFSSSALFGKSVCGCDQFKVKADAKSDPNAWKIITSEGNEIIPDWGGARYLAVSRGRIVAVGQSQDCRHGESQLLSNHHENAQRSVHGLECECVDKSVNRNALFFRLILGASTWMNRMRIALARSIMPNVQDQRDAESEASTDSKTHE